MSLFEKFEIRVVERLATWGGALGFLWIIASFLLKRFKPFLHDAAWPEIVLAGLAIALAVMASASLSLIAWRALAGKSQAGPAVSVEAHRELAARVEQLAVRVDRLVELQMTRARQGVRAEVQAMAIEARQKLDAVRTMPLIARPHIANDQINRGRSGLALNLLGKMGFSDAEIRGVLQRAQQDSQVNRHLGTIQEGETFQDPDERRAWAADDYKWRFIGELAGSIPDLAASEELADLLEIRGPDPA